MALRVLVTRAGALFANPLLYSIAKGDVFGKDQQISLVMLDAFPMLEGVVMELQDCALPLLKDCIATASVSEAFKDIDTCIMLGLHRKEGVETVVERNDWLKANIKIFKDGGKALDSYAKKTCKVLVVGNSANTNCYTMMKNAPSIPTSNFSCLTRLDQNRAQVQIAMRLGTTCDAVTNAIIWGNHSTTQFPDAAHAKVNGIPVYDAVNGIPVYNALSDDYLKGEFITTVQTRGDAVIKARKISSAMSTANAICDHMRDWWCGTKEDQWVSMGVLSTGNKYGVAEDLIFSFPVRINADREWQIVDGLPISAFAREKLNITTNELTEEQDEVEFLSA
ncbi:malate dehydrogenase, cytoplasmic-like [Amphiura filiformis]|uniref:malate dehydrogenase, cytoplasmic-like n=1 Tax=Amphiura filiformis TaxID=82378 RepID=UPI003B2252DE